MDPNALFTVAVEILLLLLAISVHEGAHAWMAARCGDPTAQKLGRVTLNPLRHLDPAGSLFFPGVLLVLGLPVFGWGKPTPRVDENLRHRGRDEVLVLAAGSVANLLLAGLAFFALIAALVVLGPEARQAGSMVIMPPLGEAARPAGFPLMFTLVRMVLLNVFLAAFNLIPMPPLDGGQIALHLLPPDWAAKLAALRPYGFMIGVAFALIGVLPLFFLVSGVLVVVINLF
jgi:Zn-dependent protease